MDEKYIDIRNKLTKQILDISYKSKEGHIASSLSIIDIIYTVYKNFLLKNSLDKFILSKGHGSLALYTILEYFNILNPQQLESFCSFDSVLGGHPTIKIPGVEASTGSLGHGLPIAVGMALAKKIKNESGTIFCLIGDGESNEGTTWESAMVASHHKLDNLCCILDHNKSTNRALNIGNMRQKFEAFEWLSFVCDGHSIHSLENIFKHIPGSDRPIFIQADTIKGKGIKNMENNPEWHHKIPNSEEYEKFTLEIQ